MRARRRWVNSYAVRTPKQAGVPVASFRLMTRTWPTALQVAVAVAVGHVAGVLALRIKPATRGAVRQHPRGREASSGATYPQQCSFWPSRWLLRQRRPRGHGPLLQENGRLQALCRSGPCPRRGAHRVGLCNMSIAAYSWPRRIGSVLGTVWLPERLQTLQRVPKLTGLQRTGSSRNLDGGFDAQSTRKAIFNCEGVNPPDTGPRAEPAPAQNGVQPAGRQPRCRQSRRASSPS